MTLHLHPNPIVHRIHLNLAASQTSVSSSAHREQTGIEIEEDNRPLLPHLYPTCPPHSLPFQLHHRHPTRSMFLHLLLPLLCHLPLWSHQHQGHPRPPLWLRQVPNCSTRDCALSPSPRDFPSPLTYPLKPRAFARDGALPISPAWRARSEVQ